MNALHSLAAAWRRHRPLLLLLAVVAASWGLFLEVAHELREDRRQPDHGFPFDRPVLNFLHQRPTPALCAVAARLSDLRGPVWLSVYALGIYGLGWGLYRRRYREVGFAVGAVGGTMAFNLLAKYHFERLRPDFYHQCGRHSGLAYALALGGVGHRPAVCAGSGVVAPLPGRPLSVRRAGRLVCHRRLGGEPLPGICALSAHLTAVGAATGAADRPAWGVGAKAATPPGRPDPPGPGLFTRRGYFLASVPSAWNTTSCRLPCLLTSAS
nr:hypothetical protein [Tanacetum cinerariifolium]